MAITERFLQQRWCDLDWTAFMPFDAELADFRQIPASSGVYRVRVQGQPVLAYIGQTGRNLRQRLLGLRSNTLADQMPFNDPHTAAPRLWSYRDAKGLQYECSAASVDSPKALRLALECSLIWQYRLEHGCSPLCNFGRLHPQYMPSRNRTTGKRGYRLPDDQKNENIGPSVPPLRLRGDPVGPDWMGLEWSRMVSLSPGELAAVPSTPGVYKLAEAEKLLYLGESDNLRNRLTTHCRGPWAKRQVSFSYCNKPRLTLGCQRLELENDLIAAYYSETQHTPEFQFSGPG